MNIANTGGTLTPMPSHIASVDGTAHAALGPDADCVDPTAPAQTDAQFAKVLTQRMAKNDANDPTPNAPAAPSSPTDATKVDGSSKDAKTDTASDAIGNDLAAQLALASQWAGVAQQASAQSAAASAAGRASPEPLDIGGKLAAAREATGKGDAADQATASIDARALDAARPEAKRGLAVTTRANEDQSKGEQVAQAGSDATRSVEASIGVAQPTTTHALSDANAFNALANLATAHGTAASAPTPALPDALRQMVGTPAWAHEVGGAMVRMAVDDLQSAALRLNPEHLGPLDVQVRVDNGVAHLAFQAAHADTRQAIEASRPMLEQLFSEQGLKIGDCAVGDSASRNGGFNADPSQANASSRHQGPSRSAADDAVDTGAPAVNMRIARPLGMVDTFA